MGWFVPVASSLFLLAISSAASAAGEIDYPETATVPVVERQFGIDVADPYRWLEADVRTDPKVKEWVDRQNRLTEAYLKALPGREALKQRMRQLFDFERYSTPRKAGLRYFYMRNTGLQNQSVLYFREGLAGIGRVLIDPNNWSREGEKALGEWLPSDDGTLLAYAVQESGSDWRTLRIRDVQNGRDLDDEIRWVKFSQLSWRSDSSGFFYSRFPPPEPGQAFQSASLRQAVYFHRIGTAQSEDRLIYSTPDRPELRHRAMVTDDGRYLLITTLRGTDERYELHILDLAKQDAEPIPLVKGLDHNWQMIGNIGPRFWFVTDKDAPRQRIVTLDASRPRRKPVPIFAEREDTLIGASIVGERIVLAYQGDGKGEPSMITLDGKPAGAVRLPGIGTAVGFAGKVGDPETFYSFSGYTTPPTVYRFDTVTGLSTIFEQPKAAFRPGDYVTEQRFYPSKDGTIIPLYVVRKRTTIGPAPTLLYGYGGFNIAQTPGFSAVRLAWMEQGGIIAVASLRGGGEYGKAWHDAGRLLNKQNAFDDFIAAGEYLISENLTTREQLAIEGRSNGGMLVGAVVNQRPDLFAVALPAVGVMDMLRFDRFTAGRYWIDDYGSPARETDFRSLYAYSPYHNIRSGADYPAILVTTADTDDRVVPGHSFKYAARLQASEIGVKPHLIRIQTRAGHGSGKPTEALIEESANVYAFAAKWTGLEIRPIERP